MEKFINLSKQDKKCVLVAMEKGAKIQRHAVLVKDKVL